MPIMQKDILPAAEAWGPGLRNGNFPSHPPAKAKRSLGGCWGMRPQDRKS